ncbi:A24 family peptidase [Shewanella sp. C32]|uniref:Prepilin leader peptidase/N-methyltransferase n=1 Tax=Shewanella electrica TaxID=515560 RepID=A0ABT2FN63_9GAMM|nr:A24 family peptidase [Shewanella electrica]MCH1926143.1 A24 family peptidase [Shewanella electrica]MCS4557693.1 A24 family peptidase [Shewanella electrica]
MQSFISLMGQYPTVFITLAFVFAAVIGSFINVVIFRLPVMMKRGWQQECEQFLEEYQPAAYQALQQQKLLQPLDKFPERFNLVVPNSTCPKCKTAIKPWHNLPLVGWLLLGGKCAACKQPISPRYPLFELLNAVLVAVLAWHFGPTMQFALAAVLTFALVAMSGIDLDEMLLPDQLTLPFMWLGIIASMWGSFTTLESSVIGAIAGYLSLWSVFWLFKLLTGKEGMGYGDFKLMALFGAWLGWQMLPLIILLSSAVGAVVGILLMVFKGNGRNYPIPFGPYIAIAGWVALCWGNDIVNWYLSTL